jgi:hypothetical protein
MQESRVRRVSSSNARGAAGQPTALKLQFDFHVSPPAEDEVEPTIVLSFGLMATPAVFRKRAKNGCRIVCVV